MTENETKMLTYLGPMFRLDNRRRFGLTCADFGRAEVIFGFIIWLLAFVSVGAAILWVQAIGFSSPPVCDPTARSTNKRGR